MEVDARVFPDGVTLAFQIEFFRGPNLTFFCTSDEVFITPSDFNRAVPVRVSKTRLSDTKIPAKGAVSVVLKIYYKGNLVRPHDVGGENYNFLNERFIPNDLAAKSVTSKKRAREPDHEIDWADVRFPEEDMDVSGIKKWTKKNYANFAELNLTIRGINNSSETCELMEYECVLHIENKEMQRAILYELQAVL